MAGDPTERGNQHVNLPVQGYEEIVIPGMEEKTLDLCYRNFKTIFKAYELTPEAANSRIMNDFMLRFRELPKEDTTSQAEAIDAVLKAIEAEGHYTSDVKLGNKNTDDKRLLLELGNLLKALRAYTLTDQSRHDRRRMIWKELQTIGSVATTEKERAATRAAEAARVHAQASAEALKKAFRPKDKE